LPNRYSQAKLVKEINQAGYNGWFDFLYLPIDHETGANKGYAFINFKSSGQAWLFKMGFEGSRMTLCPSSKVVSVTPATLQGFRANFAHYASASASRGAPRVRPFFLREAAAAVQIDPDDFLEECDVAAGTRRGRRRTAGASNALGVAARSGADLLEQHPWLAQQPAQRTPIDARSTYQTGRQPQPMGYPPQQWQQHQHQQAQQPQFGFQPRHQQAQPQDEGRRQQHDARRLQLRQLEHELQNVLQEFAQDQDQQGSGQDYGAMTRKQQLRCLRLQRLEQEQRQLLEQLQEGRQAQQPQAQQPQMMSPPQMRPQQTYQQPLQQQPQQQPQLPMQQLQQAQMQPYAHPQASPMGMPMQMQGAAATKAVLPNFCPECSLETSGYPFCGSCGTNLWNLAQPKLGAGPMPM